MKLHCMNCGKETELNKIYNDDLGYHRVCPECGASHDIDDETAFEFEKYLYEPMVRAALKDGWSPRAVRSSIYELFQEYCISEDTEDYLYGLADPLFGITALNNTTDDDKDCATPASDWWNDYPCPDLRKQYGKEFLT